jgi:hypothetical protein
MSPGSDRDQTAGSSQFIQSPYRAPYRGNHPPQNRPQLYYPQPGPAPQALVQAPQQQQAQVQRRNNLPTRRYNHLPVPQTGIFKQLVAEGMISPVPARSWVPPYPAWFNPNVTCAYHGDVPGHSTENCTTLRQKINELIDAGSLKLNPVGQEIPNDQPEINNVASEEDINFIWPEKQGKDMHVSGDDLALSNIRKISRKEEDPRNSNVAPVIFPEI